MEERRIDIVGRAVIGGGYGYCFLLRRVVCVPAFATVSYLCTIQIPFC
jgi:hypothetical protein